jgi:hypothetical protein
VWIIVSICAGAAVGFYLFGTVRNGTASTSSTPKMMNQASGGRRTDERLSIDPIH